MRHGPLVFFVVAAALHGQSAVFQWIQQIGGSQGQAIAGIGTDSKGNIYVAGSTSSLDFPVKSAIQPHPGSSGLLRVDGPGGPWQNLYGSGFNSVTALSSDPRDPNTIYAVADTGLVRSTDAGVTWTALAQPAATIYAVAVDPTASNVLYAATYANGVSKSVDGGATWTPSNNGIPPWADGEITAFNVWVDPRQPNVVFAATFAGLARSGDGGATWQTNTQLNQLARNGGMAFDPNTPGLIYLGGFSGLQRSADDGVTWTSMPGPTTAPVEVDSIAIDPRHPGTLYVSTPSSGISQSVDGGNTWTSRYAGNVNYLVGDSATGALYAAVGSRILASLDGFKTSTPVGPATAGIASVLLAGPHLFVGSPAGSDVLVAKFDPQGNPVYATYFGGAGYDQANGMAVDAGGSVYVTGTTGSSDFPVSPGAYASSGGSFVFKLNPDGTLGYSTYFAAGSTPNAIAVDGAGHAWIAGMTGTGLPVTAGAYQTQFQATYPPCCNIAGPGPPPPTNAFLAEFDPAGAALVFSTYVGSQQAVAFALALEPDGSAVLAGSNALYRISADGSALAASATLPGAVWALAADGAGNIYAGGATNGTINPLFPATSGAFQTAPFPSLSLPGTLGNAGGNHAFITKFDPQFKILASTLLAGESSEETLALAVAADGGILAAGSTYSQAFPTRGPAQGAFSSATGFVTKLSPDLASAIFSTYAGDTRMFTVRTVAPTPDGGVLFGGASGPVPFYSEYGTASGLNPGYQAFLVKAGVQPAMPRIDAAVNAASQLGVPLSPGGVFQVKGAGFGGDATLLVNGTALPLISQSSTSLTAALPTDFTAQGAATVVVQSGGSSSNPYLAPVAAAAPGVYSADGSGTGQGLILNQDGTRNSPGNPAQEGSSITICATGVGSLTFDHGYAVTASPPDVYIDGFYASGIAAVLGPMAGLPGNVYRISVYVPHPADWADRNPNLINFVMPPQVAVTLVINGAKSQASLALSVGNPR
jgi:uncharacterized protein (TIGR03437 family)